jgi:uncharacterized NAD-dependent epimerase/dehydratase family protein
MIPRPYLVFLGDVQDPSAAKTGFGLRDWAPDSIVGQMRLPNCGVDLGVAELTLEGAVARGAGSLVIGVAPVGGQIAPAWIAPLRKAIEAGLDIVSGLHARLSDIPALAEAAKAHNRNLHDVRHADRSFPVGNGRKRTGKRVLMVGTDCAVGKKYSALCVARELASRDVPHDFRATGQTGIMLSGNGVAIDAVIADFISGAAETLSPAAHSDHWDVIEGQGSIFHPAYAGVTVGLLHGSQPDALILCHDPSRTEIEKFAGYPIPALGDALDLYLRLARLTNPEVRFVGLCLNTSSLKEEDAREIIRKTSASVGLPATDPLRFGVANIVDAMLAQCSSSNQTGEPRLM